MTQLVSFLGKVQGPGGYRRTRYTYRGETWPATAYFGLELARRLQVERLVLFGTPGSMWDMLLSDHFGNTELAAAHDELLAAAQRGQVQAEQLETLRPLIERAVGRPVFLQLVDNARTRASQQALLAALAAIAAPGDTLWLDVTHGYRHLGMLALVAAAFLRSVQRVKVAGLVYAAGEMAGPDNTAPVIELDGLLDMFAWVEALAAYDASGDLAQLASPLAAAGLEAPSVERWRQAAFDERNQNTEAAVGSLRQIRGRLRELSTPALDLLRPQLEQRLAWTEGAARWQHEWALAERHLERGDWLRAAILFAESVVSHQLAREPRAGSHAREQAGDELVRAGGPFQELMRLRNALAHGNPGGDSQGKRILADLIASRQRLPTELRRLAAALRRAMDTASLPKQAAGAEPPPN